jgi:hypothetical protein
MLLSSVVITVRMLGQEGGKRGQWELGKGTQMMPLPPLKVLTEAVVWTGSSYYVKGQQSGPFRLENRLEHSQNLCDVRCIDGFTTALSKRRRQQQPRCQRSFTSFGYFSSVTD